MSEHEQDHEITDEEIEALADDIAGVKPVEGDGFFYDDVARVIARARALGELEEEEA